MSTSSTYTSRKDFFISPLYDLRGWPLITVDKQLRIPSQIKVLPLTITFSNLKGKTHTLFIISKTLVFYCTIKRVTNSNYYLPSTPFVFHIHFLVTMLFHLNNSEYNHETDIPLCLSQFTSFVSPSRGRKTWWILWPFYTVVTTFTPSLHSTISYTIIPFTSLSTVKKS